LAEELNKKLGKDSRTIRLLSCSNLEAAQDLSKNLNNRKIIASNEDVLVYHDGTVSSGQFYEIIGDTRKSIDNPNPPKKGITDKTQFVMMADYSEYVMNGARINEMILEEAFQHQKNIKLNGVKKASYSRASGLIGGHEKQVFMKETITKNDGRIEIISQTAGTINGVEIIQYKVRELDKWGKIVPNEYFKSGTVFTKTVYDSNVISDKSMKDMGYIAFKDAMDNNKFYPEDARTFKGIANGQIITGHYKEVNGEKVLNSWWLSD